MTAHRRLLVFLSFLFLSSGLSAQPANDLCSNAIQLTDLDSWCSAKAAYTNSGATLDPFIQPTCFPDVTHDVWFSFVAQATDLAVTVVGSTSGQIPPGGTMENPQFVIYSGNCTGGFTELQCASDGFGTGVAETFAGPLQVGQTYYIRVDARNGGTGTFQLCINNFNAVPSPSGDCPTGPILCDKSSFTVGNLVGTGLLNNEIDPGICIGSEFASAWYRWTCKDPGTLTFTITPNNPSDDIDFAVFELPGGIDDCANKVKVRCEAAGENVGQPFSNWEPCTGATGLSNSETDTDEFPGCAPGQNNFVSALVMEAGKSYALIINNFSNTGNGFTIDFGGSGTFQGPEADFTTAPPLTACTNQDIIFTDNSNSVDPIASWEWTFGPGASPASASGQGPHTVSYSTPGVKSIVLKVTNEEGCIVTSIKTIEILPSPEVTPTVVSDYCGPNDQTGGIYLSAGGAPAPFQFEWQNSGVLVPDSFLLNVETGTYSVGVVSANGCRTDLDVIVPEGLSLQAGVNPVNPPTCNGDSDGSISISIAIANYPIQYDFGSGLQPDSFLTNIAAGTYQVYVIDAAGCDATFDITVEDFPPLLLGLDPTDISCFGEVDGSITAMPEGGAGNYTYAWSNNGNTQTISNLPEGNYELTVTDANGCTTTSSAGIIEPPPLAMGLDLQHVVCFGFNSGIINVIAEGGTPPYEYSLDGTDFQTDPALSNLFAGDYTVYLRDARGCLLTQPATITQPPPLVVYAGEDQVVDLGYTVNLNGVVTPMGIPVTLSWTPAETLTCSDCTNPTAQPFTTTTYVLTAVDGDGCSAADSVIVNVNVIRPVYIPSAFSPNNDGINDFFSVYGGPAARSVLTFRVFNRWGGLVYEGFNLPLNDEKTGWDGTFKGQLMDPAVFAYYAEVEFIDGVVVLFEGDVTLVR